LSRAVQREGFSLVFRRLRGIFGREETSPADSSAPLSEAFLRLAASGKMPKGAQRSADRKLPQFEARIERYRRLLDGG
jgi:hypothetical protein